MEVNIKISIKNVIVLVVVLSLIVGAYIFGKNSNCNVQSQNDFRKNNNYSVQSQNKFSERETKSCLVPSNAVPSIDESYEVHYISGYNAQNPKVKLLVNRPGKNVILILTSYENILWEVAPVGKTKVRAVISSGNRGGGPYIKAPKNTILYLAKISHSYNRNNVNFYRTLSLLDSTLNIKKIDSFFGEYTLPSLLKIDGVQNDIQNTINYPEVKKSPVDYNFKLMTNSGYKDWSISGPINHSEGSAFPLGSYAFTPDGVVEFQIGKDSLVIKNNKNESEKNYPIPVDFPKFSWTQQIAFAPDKNLIVLGTNWHVGYFYRFDYKNKKWLDSTKQAYSGMNSLVYDSLTKHFYAQGLHSDSGYIYELSIYGDIIKKYDINNKLEGYEILFDKNNGPSLPLSLVPMQKHIVIIAFDRPPFSHSLKKMCKIKFIWLYDKETSNAILTYKNLS